LVVTATQETQMAELPSHPDTDNDAGQRPAGGPASGTPRWLTVVGIIVAIVVVALVAVLHLTGVIGPGAH
jgi:hypothetical protein